MPAVSVIIPTYNRSGYLVQAVESVLNQTFGDLEVVVVDDGSTDDTARVLRSLNDPRVKPIHQANAGRSAAR
ncbi:MAG TPA: glycosyltransferase, partial [Candidatus Hydrogenedentes bacterium]|nr:glycosyltransferase [Candidatus Hydrogenedentota bacterium]